MALIVKDSFELVTPLGNREIQLLVGDITKQPATEKVDIVITSAYYGDYSPIATTLIGSLANNLDISVHQLAMDKEVDLRSNFSCWISKPLEPHLPYKRLVCFEYMRKGSSLIEQISTMFRAMMPIFNNKDTTVITPLLATGDQGHSVLKVLSGMVNAACEWIKAGLPLKCLKLVVYSPKPTRPSQICLECAEWFSNLKKKWMELESISEVENIPYDVCLSWSPENKELAQKVVEHLLKENSSLKVFSDSFVHNYEDVWQKHIYSVMKSSKRVVVLLTPSYLASSECLEQFNIALCCSRLKQEDTLVPFYMETISSFPSYMILVQYIDCRIRKAGQTQDTLLQMACSSLLKPAQFKKSDMLDSRADDIDNEVLERNREITYDIFVSYSHNHGKEPKDLFEILKRDHPEFNIFFDVSELKAGNLWQQVLYETVSKALCVVAFISPSYLTSSVCLEEFNIALGRHFIQDSIAIIPLAQANIQHVPRSYASIPIVDIKNENLETLAKNIVHLVQSKQNNTTSVNISSLSQEMEVKRSSYFKQNFKLDSGHIIKNSTVESSQMKGQVVFSYAPEMVYVAAIMATIMKKHAPQLGFHLLATSQSQRRMHLDTADLVVIFISDQYLTSSYLVEELHTVLCRQRAVKESTIIYLVQCNHKLTAPIYLQLLPFNISLDDHFWSRMKGAAINKNPTYEVDIDGMAGTYRCSPEQNLALTSAALDAIYTLTLRGQGSKFTCSIENIYKVHNDIKKIPGESVYVQEHSVTLSAFFSDIVKQQEVKQLHVLDKSNNIETNNDLHLKTIQEDIKEERISDNEEKAESNEVNKDQTTPKRSRSCTIL